MKDLGSWQAETKKVKKIQVDNQTVTAIMLPSKAGYGSKAVQKTWKNYCPLCKKSGTLEFNPKHTQTGEWTCKACDADYCGVSGKDKAKKVRGKLTPATVLSNGQSSVASTQTQSQRCNLTSAQAKTKAQQQLNTGTKYEGKLEVDHNILLNVNSLLRVDLTGYDDTKMFEAVKAKTLFVNSCDYDIDNGKLTLDLLQGSQALGTAYSGDYIVTNSTGAIVATNRNKNNPLQGVPTTINPNMGGIKEQSTDIKKIMLKGQALGTVSKIYKYLKVKEAGGTGGFKYKYYIGHKYSTEKETDLGKKSLAYAWKKKVYNCVDSSWLFYVMCKGAGKKVSIIKSEYTGLDGVKRGHMYNRYGGKTYDVSQNLKQEVDGSKIVQIQK